MAGPPRSWKNLPPELAGLVLGRQLPSHVDRFRFAAVCPQWRSTARQVRLPPPLPLLALKNGRTFYSMPSGCFPRLQVLSIWHAPQLNQVQIEQGAMSNLAELYLGHCPMLKFPPQGIEHLKNLVELYLRDTSEELVERLWRKGGPDECKDDSMDISHIRKVTVRMGTREWIM